MRKKFVKPTIFLATVLTVGFLFATSSVQAQDGLELFPKEGESIKDFRNYISSFYLFSLGASILIAVMMMIIGGVIWLTSAGNPGRISRAKEYIINAIIGVVLLLGAYTIVQAINPKLVSLEDPNLPPIPSFGSCATPGKPDNASIKEATHTCVLSTQSECKSTGTFNEKSCEKICDKYSGTDGSCLIKSTQNFAGETLEQSEKSCKDQKILIYKSAPDKNTKEAAARVLCANYCQNDIPEGKIMCISQTQTSTIRSDIGNTHRVNCSCIAPN